MRLPSHLRRHPTTGLFSFRIATPRRLLAQVGKTEIIASLQTRNQAEAKRLSYFYSAYWVQEFTRMGRAEDKALLEKELLEKALTAVKDRKIHKSISIAHPSGMVITADTPEEQNRVLESLGMFRVQTPAPIYQPAPPQTSIMLGSAVDKVKKRWAEAYSRSKTLHAKCLALDEFRAFVGQDRKQVHNITRKDVIAFRQHLEAKGLAPATVFVKTLYIKQFFAYLIANNDMVGDNPAKPDENAPLQNQKEKKISSEYFGWQQFSPEELKTIFEPKNYLTRLKAKQGKALAPAEYFLPLLCLYTGARVNELAQLKLSDITQESGLTVINIGAEINKKKISRRQRRVELMKDQSIKTASSARKIPLHIDLRQTSFNDYVQGLQERGEEWLFPYLNKTANGHAGKESTAFTRYLEKLGISEKAKKGEKKDGAKVGYHSFRKNFSKMAETAPAHQVNYYQGWEAEGTRMGEYHKEFEPANLSAGVLSLIKPGVDLQALALPADVLLSQIEALKRKGLRHMHTAQRKKQKQKAGQTNP